MTLCLYALSVGGVLLRDFGVDTTRLIGAASMLKIEPGAHLQLDRGALDMSTGEIVGERLLYHSLDGAPVYGTRARLNTPDFQLTILPGGQTAPYATLQMSAAAYAEDNLSLHNADSLHDAMRWVESDLSDMGVHWPLAAASMFGLAVTRNMDVTEEYSHYMAALQACNGRKTTKKSDYGETGVEFGNKQRSTLFYAKREEMKAHGKDYERCSAKKVRGEATFLKSGAVLKATGVKTIPDLCLQFDRLPAVYFQEMQRDIFRPSNEPRDADCFNWDAMFAAAASARRPMVALGSEAWALALVSQHGLKRAEALINKWFPDRESRNTRGEMLRDVRAASTQLELEKLAPCGSPLKKLYLELKNKTLAPLLLAA